MHPVEDLAVLLRPFSRVEGSKTMCGMTEELMDRTLEEVSQGTIKTAQG
jgi:hypothetical protein